MADVTNPMNECPVNGTPVGRHPAARSSLGSRFQGALDVRATERVSMVTVFSNASGVTGGTRAPRPGSTIYIPNFYRNKWGFSSSVAIFNPNNSPTTVTAVARDEQGTTIGSSSHVIPAIGSVLVVPNVPSDTHGSLTLTSSAGAIAATVNESGSGVARAFDGTAQPSETLHVPSLEATATESWSLAIMNTTSSVQTVSLQYVNPLNGAILDSEQIDLAANGFRLVLPGNRSWLMNRRVSAWIGAQAGKTIAAVTYAHDGTSVIGSAMTVEPAGPLIDATIPVPTGSGSVELDVHNPGTSSRSITYRIRDVGGTQVGTQTVTIDAGQSMRILVGSTLQGQGFSVSVDASASVAAALRIGMTSGRITIPFHRTGSP